jgi:hypothetical protein
MKNSTKWVMSQALYVIETLDNFTITIHTKWEAKEIVLAQKACHELTKDQKK